MTDPPWERKSVSCVNLFLLQKLTVTKWNSSDTVNTKTEFLSYFWSDSDFLADFWLSDIGLGYGKSTRFYVMVPLTF